jgi:protein SCO1/2/putative membrane protein
MRSATFRLVLAALCLAGCASVAPAQDARGTDLDPVGEFRLTERDGRTVTDQDLRGKVWVASFQFTRCTAGCPQVAESMRRLQRDLAGRPDVVLVTFTVDPKRDTLDDLRAYADRYGADPERWLFLTGGEAEIRRLMKDGFHLSEPRRVPGKPVGADILHPLKLVVVDRRGHVRGYYDGLPNVNAEDPEQEHARDLRRLLRQVDALRLPAFMPSDVPRFNTKLNGFAAVLILLGYAAIRQQLRRLHAFCMLSALLVSALFLASYLYYHLVIKAGKSTHFAEQAVGAPDWVGYLYYGVLGTHMLLVAFATPMALLSAYLALRGRLLKHVRLARWTLPIWLCASVTGVVVYWMLYQLYPTP